MSYVLCIMSYVLCPMSYVPCPMSHVLCPMWHVPCPMSKNGEDLSKLKNLTLSSELDSKVTLTRLTFNVFNKTQNGCSLEI